MIVRGLVVAALAFSLGGCSTASSMWSKLRGGDASEQALAAPSAVTAEPNATQACDTLRRNASPDATADAVARQMAIDEMKRAGCPDIPAS